MSTRSFYVVGPDGRDVGITPHAVERFIERWVPDMSYGRADAYLRSSIATSTRLSVKTYKGNIIWRLSGNLPALLVISHDRDCPSANIVKTVLPDGAMESSTQDDCSTLFPEFAHFGDTPDSDELVPESRPLELPDELDSQTRDLNESMAELWKIPG
jgi:hypothetical protein